MLSRLRRFDLMKTLARATWLASLAACGTMQTSAPTGAPPAAGAVGASVPIGRGPTPLAISPDGSVGYAASGGQLAAIRTDTNKGAGTARIRPHTTGHPAKPARR